MSKRLTDEQLERLFCAHWSRTRDLVGSLRIVLEAARVGEAAAALRGAARARHARRARSAAAIPGDLSLVARVARADGLDVRQLIGHERSRTPSRSRFVAMWILRKMRQRSLAEVARTFGGRCTSDVVYAVRAVDERIKLEPGLRAQLRRLAGAR